MSDSGTSSRWSDLIPRLSSGGVAVVVGLAVMWLGGIWFHILIAAISGLMVWELVRMIGGGRVAKPMGIAAGLMLWIAVELPPGWGLPLLMAPALLGVSQIDHHRFTYAMYTSAIMVAGFGLVLLRDDFGFGWMVWLAMVVIVTDVLGYFAGKIIGGPKFWPRVSPKKTWSGTTAGWIGAALVGAVYVWLGHSGPELIAISVAMSMAGQLGDVAESALKRRMGVKDSSSIIPGHGGMFDRFDAMLGASILLLMVEQLIDFPPAPVPF